MMRIWSLVSSATVGPAVCFQVSVSLARRCRPGAHRGLAAGAHRLVAARDARRPAPRARRVDRGGRRPAAFARRFNEGHARTCRCRRLRRSKLIACVCADSSVTAGAAGLRPRHVAATPRCIRHDGAGRAADRDRLHRRPHSEGCAPSVQVGLGETVGGGVWGAGRRRVLSASPPPAVGRRRAKCTRGARRKSGRHANGGRKRERDVQDSGNRARSMPRLA